MPFELFWPAFAGRRVKIVVLLYSYEGADIAGKVGEKCFFLFIKRQEQSSDEVNKKMELALEAGIA